MSRMLNDTIKAFNQRRFDDAVACAAEGLAFARGRDEVFWMGLQEACEGYAHLHNEDLLQAERKLISSMHKLRNFGFRHQNFEVTGALAGIRLAVEEIRRVREGTRRIFDVSLLPQFRLAAKADD
jgi:hypothetical protein